MQGQLYLELQVCWPTSAWVPATLFNMLTGAAYRHCSKSCWQAVYIVLWHILSYSGLCCCCAAKPHSSEKNEQKAVFWVSSCSCSLYGLAWLLKNCRRIPPATTAWQGQGWARKMYNVLLTSVMQEGFSWHICGVFLPCPSAKCWSTE